MYYNGAINVLDDVESAGMHHSILISGGVSKNFGRLRHWGASVGAGLQRRQYPVDKGYHRYGDRLFGISALLAISEQLYSMEGLEALIDSQRWEEVRQHLLMQPQGFETIVHSSSGWYPLHWLCAIGSTPASLIELAVEAFPGGLTVPDRRYSDTPLHLCCRHSQVTTSRSKALLSHYPSGSKDILARNVLGGTCLHSAVNHNANIEVIKAIVEVNPKIARVRTYEGAHVISALWNSYLQTIQGHMCIARALKGHPDDKVSDSHFVRFWDKAEYLALQSFRQSETCPGKVKDTDKDPTELMIHALLQCDINVQMYKLALKLYPNGLSARNAHGDLPLHVLIQNRPFRLKERDAILATVAAFPDAAKLPNDQGENPLFIGIRNKVPWENGLDSLVAASPSIIETPDNETGLLPFQVAASVGGNVSVNTTFNLLTIRPDLLNK